MIGLRITRGIGMNGKMRLITATLIFGSIGVFVKKIDLTSSEIAFLRGVIGSIFLLLASFLVKHKPSLKALKENAILLLLSGAAVGFNWIFLLRLTGIQRFPMPRLAITLHRSL